MKFIYITIYFLIIPLTAWSSTYVYPEKIEVDFDCDLPLKKIQEIESYYSDSEMGWQGVAKAKAVDLNSDGICEVFLDTPAMYEGNGNASTSIIFLENEKFKQVGNMRGYPKLWWYGKPVNGYPRIFVPSNAGHRTNPILVTDVFYFNKKRFVLEFDSKFSHGRYMELALKAYKSKKYNIAENYYLNAFRMNGEKRLQDANNVSIVWIKQKKYNLAEKLLTKLIKTSKDKKQLASAYYNIGLINEKQNKIETALSFYEKSNIAWPTLARKNKINKIKNLTSK